MPRELEMPDFLQEDADTIHDRMLQNAPKDINLVQGDFFWDATRLTAEEKAELVLVKLQNILKLAFPQTSYSQFLEFLGETKGVFKHPATRATGIITIRGAEGTEIKKGHIVSTIATDDRPAIEFELLEDAIIGEDGIVHVPAMCTQAGTIGNVAKDTITLLSKPISGVESITNEEEFRNGSEIEDEESFRERVLEAYRNEPLSGAPRDYVRWAKEVPGVGEAHIIPEWDGPGTVKVLVLDSNREPAGEELLKEVRKHIIGQEENGKNISDGLAPIGALVTIETPEIVNIDISVNIVFEADSNTESIIANIKKNISNYLSSLSINGIVTYKAIEGILGSMIIKKEGILDYSNLLMNGSTDNIQLEYQVPYLNEVIIT